MKGCDEMKTLSEVLERLLKYPKFKKRYLEMKEKERQWDALPEERKELVMTLIKIIIDDFKDAMVERLRGVDEEARLYLRDIEVYPTNIPDEFLELVLKEWKIDKKVKGDPM